MTSGTQDPNEAERLDVLRGLDILDSLPERCFDQIANLARSVLQMPVALLVLVDEDRVWIKSRQGFDVEELPRTEAICHYTIQSSTPLIITDTLEDPRTAQLSTVVDPPHIRFYAGAPLLSKSGHALGSLCVMDKVPRSFDSSNALILKTLASMATDEMELRHLAGNDSLTGALTRRAFEDLSTAILARARISQTPCCALMVDIDHFKSVNDRFGHKTGDTVLMQLVDILRSKIKRPDLIGRRGGEEFCIFLENTTIGQADILASDIRQTIETTIFANGDSPLNITISIGAAQCQDADTTVADVIGRADHALYSAKSGGRNRVVLAAS